MEDILGTFLAERTRLCRGDADAETAGDFVLYWMRTALRAEENPALDVARSLANHLGVGVLVYHALSERYPYASDRHHTFILEGARDVQAELADREVPYAFHLERRGHRGPHLLTLGNRAAAVVTEEMPVEPLRRWTELLARQLPCAVYSVDTACVVPMQMVGKPFTRAYAYRNATRQQYEQRVSRPYPELSTEPRGGLPDNLPFTPVDLQQADLAALVRQCDIDHAVGPAPHTPGGSQSAIARWNAFRDERLDQYAAKRNDLLAGGVSRMSPYLHYGMISPLRLAREAAVVGGKGADKYLDELLIWRELAHAFCFYRRDIDRVAALPDWARETLAEHRSDPRPALYSWERLARGRTGDRLWDAAQRSLLVQGELHNNIRMTWAKAIAQWTPDEKTALAMMIDLNHRYALDGRDPSSYGGILWALGQFDRPFPPERPILGVVRERSTASHARRVDVESYERTAAASPIHPPPSVAVVGAGLSGLMCARTLADHGLSVTVYEKSRGVGGRMATRRSGDLLQFDHGAQYFTVRDKRFRRYVDAWEQDGRVGRWTGPFGVLEHGQWEQKECPARYVAIPKQNSICQHLAEELVVRSNVRVAPLARVDERWRLTTENGEALGDYDAAVVTAPAAQTAVLLEAAPTIARVAGEIKMSLCWAVMVAWEESLDFPVAGAFVDQSPLSWIACNSRKPGRTPTPECWVLHASAEWSDAHAELTPEEGAQQLLEAFWEATGLPPRAPIHCQGHRWRYAIPVSPHEAPVLCDPGLAVAACGDWCDGPRIEGAFLSGMAAAGALLGVLSS